MARDDSGLPRWRPPRRSPTFLFPVRALPAVFRGKFIHALQDAQATGRLWPDRQAHPVDSACRIQALLDEPWLVYAKTPLAGTATVLDCLSRYTHRTAIGNERLLRNQDDAVHFETRINRRHGDDSGPCSRWTQLAGTDCVSRLMLHVVPKGLKRIRHFGLLATTAKAQRLDCARALLQMPPANPALAEDVAQFMSRVAGIDIERCPHCSHGRWQAIACQGPIRRRPARATPEPAQPSRGPP